MILYDWSDIVTIWIISFPHVFGFWELQYLKHVRLSRDLPIFERFPVLICITIVWLYSVILTASGAYREKPIKTQLSCRTDRANLISTAPWYIRESFPTYIKLCCVGSQVSFVILFQVQVPIPSTMGPTYIFSGSFFCYDVCSSCINGWGISSVSIKATRLSCSWYTILHPWNRLCIQLFWFPCCATSPHVQEPVETHALAEKIVENCMSKFMVAWITLALKKLLLNLKLNVAVNWCIQGSISVSYCYSTSRLCIEQRHWLAGEVVWHNC